MPIVRAIKLGIARVLRFVMVITIAVSGLIIVAMGLIIVAFEDTDEV